MLAASRHEGPLRIQKALYPEGREICHAIVLHPPAGIAGGDQLRIDVDVGAEAQALLTTPGAGKWYRSAEAMAEQAVTLKVSRDGTAEWLPQESIVFDAAPDRLPHPDASHRGQAVLNQRTTGFRIFCSVAGKPGFAGPSAIVRPA